MVDLRRVNMPVASLRREPNGALERQLLFGDAFDVESEKDGWVYGKRPSDGYTGWIGIKSLKGWAEPTHKVCDLGAHVYPKANIKTVPTKLLPFQALLTVVGERGDFVELAGGGYVHTMQIEPVAVTEPDIVRVAEKYLGVPYLWGGNSQFGLDCSGLVSAAMRGAGLDCAGDSGDQEQSLGTSVPKDAPLARGDAIFWRGHVGLMFDDRLLLHANGYHMKVAFEPLATAAERIAQSGGGEITSVRRL